MEAVHKPTRGNGIGLNNPGLLIELYRKDRPDYAHYLSRVVRAQDIPEATSTWNLGGRHRLVSTTPIQPEWDKELRRLMRLADPMRSVYLGFVEMWHSSENSDTVITLRYKPKESLDHCGVKVSGIGYFTELLILRDLHGEFTHVSTSDSPSDSRVGQLEKAGLPARKRVLIGEWMEGLERGLQRSLSKTANHSSVLVSKKKQ